MQHTVNEVVDIVLSKGIPAGPIYNVRQITEDAHIAKYREMFIEVEHPVIGKMIVNGCPVKLMDSMPRINYPAPTLGQDNTQVYTEFAGYSEEELAQMEEDGVI